MKDLAASLDALRRMWADSPLLEKMDDDLARYEIIIEAVRPDVVVETGLHYGGSAHWFAERVPEVGSVERDAQMIRDYRDDHWGLGPPPPNVTVFDGDSLRRFEDVAEWVDGRVCVVSLDSDHGTELVHAEMERYGALVSPGSYMVVEDGIYHYLERGARHEGNWYEGDPCLAIRRFLGDHPDWASDSELEDAFAVTHHPDGWLRRA